MWSLGEADTPRQIRYLLVLLNRTAVQRLNDPRSLSRMKVAMVDILHLLLQDRVD